MTIKDLKQLINYWVSSSDDDINVAETLYRSKKYSYCLFFCHLAIEKMLKAVVVAKLREHAPLTHNLPFLAGKADLVLDKDYISFLVEMTRWNLEARYPADLLNLKNQSVKGVRLHYLPFLKIYSHSS